MKLSTVIRRSGIVLSCIALLVVMLEMFSVLPGYVTEQAKILNVQDDSGWGYIGEDKRTLVQWPDGSRGYIPGAMGEPGEVIPASRQSGTTSLFGVLADRRR